jgi:hypothetical protein
VCVSVLGCMWCELVHELVDWWVLRGTEHRCRWPVAPSSKLRHAPHIGGTSSTSSLDALQHIAAAPRSVAPESGEVATYQ